MDIQQLAKTTQWLDEERRKDKKEITTLQERVSTLGVEKKGLDRKIQQLESDLSAMSATLQRVAKIDEILGGYRKDMTRQLEELEQRRAEADRESERLRKVERDGLNKSLADLRKGIENFSKLEREVQARKEEESRQVRIIAELQQKVTEFNRYVDERMRNVTVLEEGRRQDAKRITDLQTEQSELRKRGDENRGKLEVVEDLARRMDVRLAELATAEAERRSIQSQWLDAQAVAQAERDRAWNESQVQLETAMKTIEENSRRINQFSETNRDMKQAAEAFRQMAEAMERRIAEAAEIQRLAEERFRQDWAAFLADDQKRWTTHMLLRDEQWREHDRINAKQLARLDALEEHLAEALDALHHIKERDVTRLQSMLNVLRDMMAEYEQEFTQVR